VRLQPDSSLDVFSKVPEHLLLFPVVILLLPKLEAVERYLLSGIPANLLSRLQLRKPEPALHRDLSGLTMSTGWQWRLQRPIVSLFFHLQSSYKTSSSINLQLRKLEAVSAGALHRGLSADNKAPRLAAEIATMERLVRQHEHAVFCGRLVVKFREDRIKRLEDLSKDVLPVDEYYQQVRAAWARPCGPVLRILNSLTREVVLLKWCSVNISSSWSCGDPVLQNLASASEGDWTTLLGVNGPCLLLGADLLDREGLSHHLNLTPNETYAPLDGPCDRLVSKAGL
jgi:hypothetical protein